MRSRHFLAAGLAARGKSDVNANLLIASLDDKESIVRRRACQAVAACIEPEHYSIVAVTDKLAGLMIDDENDLVRKEAIRALAAVGAPADIPRLEKALTHELNQTNRAEIDKAILDALLRASERDRRRTTRRTRPRRAPCRSAGWR